MKHIIIILILVLYFLDYSNAQQQYCNCSSADQKEIFKEKLAGRDFNDFYRHDNLQFFNSWTPGTIITDQGKSIQNIYLRYNRLLDELLWLRQSDYMTIVLEKEMIDHFFINDAEGSEVLFEQIQLPSVLGGESKNVFLQVLYKGMISLYVQRKAEVLKSNNELITGNFYYLNRGEDWKRFKANRLSFMRLFEKEEKSVIRKLRREYGLSLKDEQDIRELIGLYDQMDR